MVLSTAGRPAGINKFFTSSNTSPDGAGSPLAAFVCLLTFGPSRLLGSSVARMKGVD